MTQIGLTRADVRKCSSENGIEPLRDKYDTYADKAAMISRDRMGLGDDQRLRELADKAAAKLVTRQ